MTCCWTKERWQYPAIQWCASWARYDLIISYKQLNPSQKILERTQDYLTYTTTMPIGRTPWECPVVIKEFDAQLTCVAENSAIYMIKRDESDNTFKILNLATNPATDVTWTVTPIKCEDKEIESDIVERCVDWQDFSQHIVKINWVPNGTTYWTNILWLASNPILTATTYSKWSCNLPIKTLVSAIPWCLINWNNKTDVQIEKYDTNWIVTEEVRIADFTKIPVTRTQYVAIAWDNIQMWFCNLIKNTELWFESGCVKRTISKLPIIQRKVSDYSHINDSQFMNTGIYKDYWYRINSFIVNWVQQIPNAPIDSAYWTTSNLALVWPQTAPFDTIPVFVWNRYSETNFIDFMNSLWVPWYLFRESWASESLDKFQWSFPTWISWQWDATYWDSFQIDRPKNDTFQIDVDCLYDWWQALHRMQFTESQNLLDGTITSFVPTAGNVY